MNRLVYLLALALVRFLQALPLTFVARLGRWGGGAAYLLDGRHRRVALENLANCFGREKSASELKQIAFENFKRLGESYSCGIKTAGMTFDELSPHVQFIGAEKILPQPGESGVPSRVVAIGHF